MGTLHRLNGIYHPTPTLYLNLPLTEYFLHFYVLKKIIMYAHTHTHTHREREIETGVTQLAGISDLMMRNIYAKQPFFISSSQFFLLDSAHGTRPGLFSSWFLLKLFCAHKQMIDAERDLSN